MTMAIVGITKSYWRKVSVCVQAKPILTNTDTALVWEDVRDTNNPEKFPTQYANLSKVGEPCIHFTVSLSSNMNLVS
jgi:hypothetical protein